MGRIIFIVCIAMALACVYLKEIECEIFLLFMALFVFIAMVSQILFDKMDSRK